MTYDIIKRILDNGNRNNVVTVEKLDIFLLNNRINEEEYEKLLNLLNNL